eukprot:SAG11_NODE_28263_length_323_cov_1.825893_1_plen_28_part_10
MYIDTAVEKYLTPGLNTNGVSPIQTVFL